MQEIQKNELQYGVRSFSLEIRHVKTNRRDHSEGLEPHVHSECEIYVNLSGDVSFMIEDRLYPILPGSIVITHPYEYHHCIYNSEASHEHFWILFSASGNERLFDRFFRRKKGEENLLTLPADLQRELVELCFALVGNPASDFERHYLFFRLIHLLNVADITAASSKNYPDDVKWAINYINQHFAESISIRELARQTHVSVNTLERHFADTVHMSPYSYLKKKRLAHAASVLGVGGTVMDACAQSGFSDYSAFIALFKRTYGMPPLKYKKHVTAKTVQTEYERRMI